MDDLGGRAARSRPPPRNDYTAAGRRRDIAAALETGEVSPIPRFSIIIPAYNVEGWIRECLNSVVGQTIDDFEVIIVDDRGTDSTVRIIEEYLDNPRIRMVSHDENQGLGPARNTGMDHASGEYLVFLDSDDILEPEALERIDTRARELDDPQIVIFDYRRLNWWGSLVRNQNAYLLEAAPNHTVSIADHPDLLSNFHVAWNKAYHRASIEEFGIRFPPGYYEDIPWTYPILLWADRIGLLPEPLYRYRQRFSGSILKDRSDKHFDLFDQYDRLFAAIDDLPGSEEYRPTLYRTMFDHYRALVRHGMGRIPKQSQDRYYRRVGESLKKHDYANDAGFGMGDRLRVQALRLGRRRIYAVLKRVGRGYVRVRKRYLRIRRWPYRTRHRFYRWIHRVATRLPGDPNLAVYMSYWGRSYSCNPRAIYERQIEMRPDIRAVWIINEPDAIVPDGVEHYASGTLKAYILLGRARYMVTNVNFPSWVHKHKDAIALQTQHGTPLKFMGLHLKGMPAEPNMSYSALLDRCSRWDYNLSANPFSTETWASAFPVPFRSLELGYPRNDVLYNSPPSLAASVRESLGVPPDGTLILYTPTHREYDDGFVERLDTEALMAGLPDDHYLAVRAHHTYREAEAADAKRVINVSDHPSIEELYLASDILVTDYSSTMFDYANLDRPIVLYFDDFDEYATERGMYFDIREAPPGPIAGTQDQLLDILSRRAYLDDDALAQRAAFRQRFCPYDDGNAGARVVDAVFGADSSLNSEGMP